MKTIPKNRHAAIEEMLSKSVACERFTLDDSFAGRQIEPRDAIKNLHNSHGAKLQDLDDGRFCLHVHSNHWYYFYTAEAWAKQQAEKNRTERQPSEEKVTLEETGEMIAAAIRESAAAMDVRVSVSDQREPGIKPELLLVAQDVVAQWIEGTLDVNPTSPRLIALMQACLAERQRATIAFHAGSHATIDVAITGDESARALLSEAITRAIDGAKTILMQDSPGRMLEDSFFSTVRVGAHEEAYRAVMRLAETLHRSNYKVELIHF